MEASAGVPLAEIVNDHSTHRALGFLPLGGLNRRSMFWVAAETGGNAVLLLGVMLLLARRVGAAEFALAALVVGTVQLLNLFVEGFFHDALIQDRSIDDNAFDKAFWAVECVALSLFSASIAVAVSIPEAYRRDAWLFCAAAGSLPFSGALGISNARLRRLFQYRPVAQASIVGRVVGAVLGLGLAHGGAGAWALVAQFAGGVLANTVAVYAMSSWRPTFQRRLGELAPLVRFALPYAFMHSLSALRIQGFAALVTALMGLSAAGALNVSFRLTTTPQTVMTMALMNFSFPALSGAKADSALLAATFRRVSAIVATAGLPVFVLIGMTADSLVPLILGPSWRAAIPLMQLLSMGAGVYFLRLPGSFLLRALGLVRYSFLNAAMQASLTLGALALWRPNSTIDAVICWIAPSLITFLVTPFVVARVAGFSVWRQLQGLLAPLVAAFGAGAGVWASGRMLEEQDEMARLIAKLAIGLVVYITTVVCLDPDLRRAAWRGNRMAR